MSRYGYRIINNHVYKPVPVDFYINPNSLSPRGEAERVTLANGNQVHVNNLVWDYRASACLLHLQIQLMDFGHRFVIDCDDIRFKCMSPNAEKPTENRIQACLKRMRDGKCPYGLARRLYTNIPKKRR